MSHSLTLIELSDLPMIDLHGFSREHAIEETRLFLKEQYAKGLPGVKILHGRGAGILMNELRAFLSKNKLVSEFETSHVPNEIGAVLIVKFR